ncbi:MAG: response regulator transcription factor [Sphingobacterium sp.]|jgi:DNA-binding response OmpR family regulator|uniref:response regulator transcription factor n=1 Tax=Sphingobacterium sp. TaxID=341027 RepID=UPI002828C3B5|nr:response regulator transcription factor [Sphingobacterium sp.]MDR0265153.1 response regulator transcription factor [Sphingobacterium sp.]
MHILLAEDDTRIAEFIKKGLQEAGHHVHVVYDGAMGLKLAMENNFDLLILDGILPLISGMDVCSNIRRFKTEIPIIILTALSTIEDKIKGFNCGADDYLTKPFHFEELLLRIKALGRRGIASPIGSMQYKAEDLVMDCFLKSVTRNNEEIQLTVKEYALLEYLLVNKNRVVSRAQIAEAVWGIGFNRGTNLIDVYVNYLRAKIDKGRKPLIHTVIGMGYILKGLE